MAGGKKRGETVTLPLPKGEALLSPERIRDYLEVDAKGPILVTIGQPRVGSTALAILLGGVPKIERVHFQPWKFVQRWARALEQAGQEPTVKFTSQNGILVLKETPGGPNDRKEFFNPVQILLDSGVSAEQLRVLVAVREPYSQFASWLKFDETRKATLYLEGQSHLFWLINQYREWGISVYSIIFEELYPDPKTILNFAFQKLGLELTISDASFSSNPKVVWHEADPRLDSLGLGNGVGSHYYEQVVEPVVKRRRFAVPRPSLPTDKNVGKLFEGLRKLSEEEIIALQEAQAHYLEFAKHIVLQGERPKSSTFMRYLEEYEKLFK